MVKKTETKSFKKILNYPLKLIKSSKNKLSIHIVSFLLIKEITSINTIDSQNIINSNGDINQSNNISEISCLKNEIKYLKESLKDKERILSHLEKKYSK